MEQSETFRFYGSERRKFVSEWRGCFSKKMLEDSARLLQEKRLVVTEKKADAKNDTFIVTEDRYHPYQVGIDCPKDSEEEWGRYSFHCSCGHSWGNTCVHEAAAMLYLERKNGPFMVPESDWNYHHRLREEEQRRTLDERNKAYAVLHREELPATDFLRSVRMKPAPGRSGSGEAADFVFFNTELALKDFTTNEFYADGARKILKKRKDTIPQNVFLRDTWDSGRTISADEYFENPIDEYSIETRCCMTENRFLSLTCSCSQLSYNREHNRPYNVLCEHELALAAMIQNYADREIPQDVTDDAAEKFFRRLEKTETALAKEKREQDKRTKPDERIRDILLAPRIIVENGSAELSFKIGHRNGRMFVCRNMQDMILSWMKQEEYALSKTESLRFSEYDFADEAAVWRDFIQRRVADIRDVNAVVADRAGYRYAPSLSVASRQSLSASLLDYFYDAAEGTSCEYQDKSNDIKGTEILVGHTDIRFSLVLDRYADTYGKFAGITVSGVVPVLIRGGSANYLLNSSCLSRVTRQEEKMLRPFLETANAAGQFRFRTGLSRLQEFYYRVLPRLQENACVDVIDHCGSEAAEYLPPEPAFTFFVDFENGCLSCRCMAAYEEKQYILQDADPQDSAYHDLEQERRVRSVLKGCFTGFTQSKNWYTDNIPDEALYDFLQEGMASLQEYGEVRGTEFFRRQRIVSVPQMEVGISVESGIMDITVTSKNADPEELLRILDSYHLRKKYYRLQNGDFVDLSDDETVDDVEAFLKSMEIKAADAIHGKVQLPVFRALYLDRMLEAHNAVVTTRDRTYRALVRNFRSIQNAEYEVPVSLENTVRPYQAFGFKWLRTLEDAGFGGILADEMGLGKTLEMISILLADRERGISKPSLVVCPASLVYNWEEEIRRFAPSLSCCALAGTLSERKKILESMARDKTAAEVYITSYDLLKRDIERYEPLQWNCCVLDEAQFIKNKNAAVSKSVKILHADHRFALTGTPIENRLSELWSIFDFLMPGFLYGQQEFGRRFETPIVKNKDAAAMEKLKNMAGPFILRRQKQEVLKDLPDKLEEVRYARFEGEQQKLYDAQVIHMRQMIGSGLSTGEEKIRILAELTKIRQICCDPSLVFADYSDASAKREQCMDLVKSAIDGGHRILLFSQFTSMLALLAQDLKQEGIEFYEITGSTPKQERLALVHRFNEGAVPVFLISLKAGGTGLNLTGADVVIHYDPWWNLAAQNQATDRAHRIGQTRQVTVYRMIMKDTIEEKILQLQASKKDLADAVLEGTGESLMSLSAEELLQLLG